MVMIGIDYHLSDQYIAFVDRVRNREEKPGETSRGDGELSEKSLGKRVRVPIDSILKVHTWQPDGALATGMPNYGCE